MLHLPLVENPRDLWRKVTHSALRDVDIGVDSLAVSEIDKS